MLAMALLAGCDRPVPGEDPEARGVLALEGGLIFTSAMADPIEDGVIVILDGVIEAVGPRGQVRIPPAARRVPISGLSVVPGLWNADVGLPDQLLEMADAATDEELTEALEERFTRHGFTTIVETSQGAGALTSLIERIEAGGVVGPRIIALGSSLPAGIERTRGGAGPTGAGMAGTQAGASEGLGSEVIAARAADLADRGIGLIPALTRAGYPEGGATPEEADRRRESALEEVLAFHVLGGDLVFGTGSGYVPQYDPSTDYMLLDDIGVSPEGVFAALTWIPAVRFGHDYTGLIEPGMVADLVVIEGDPLADPSAYSLVRWVLKEGVTMFNLLGR